MSHITVKLSYIACAWRYFLHKLYRLFPKRFKMRTENTFNEVSALFLLLQVY